MDAPSTPDHQPYERADAAHEHHVADDAGPEEVLEQRLLEGIPLSVVRNYAGRSRTSPRASARAQMSG